MKFLDENILNNFEIGPIPRTRKISNMTLVEETISLTKKLGRNPIKEDYSRSNTICLRFGTWNRFMDLIGLEPQKRIKNKNEFIEDQYKIIIKNGEELLFDIGDYEIAKKYNWFITNKGKNVNPAVRTKVNGKGFHINTLVFNLIKGMHIFHKNKNPFDFRRSKILILSRQEYVYKNSGDASGYNIRYHTKFSKWHVKIRKGEKRFESYFENKLEAQVVSDYIAIMFYGCEIANRNLPELSLEELKMEYGKVQEKYGCNYGEKLGISHQGKAITTYKKTNLLNKFG